MEPTWETRDLPVLEAIVSLWDQSGSAIRPDDITTATGLDSETVQKALRALRYEEPPLLGRIDGSFQGGIMLVAQPTGEARRRVGTWPTPENLADRIIAGLSRAADAEEDEEEQGRIKRLATWLGGAGRDVLVEVAGAVVARGAGLGT